MNSILKKIKEIAGNVTQMAGKALLRVVRTWNNSQKETRHWLAIVSAVSVLLLFAVIFLSVRLHGVSEKLEEAVEIYGKALTLDEEPTEASVGYWTAKTKNCTEPDVLVEEYKEMGVENMEFDLGYQAAQTLKEQYGEVFQKRYDELVTEEKPLREEVEGKRENRRAYIKARLKKTGIIYGISLLPLLLSLALALVLGGKIPTVPDNRYVAPTIVFAVLTVAFFIVSIVCLNRFWLAFRINRINEDPESTDEDARLVQIEQYKELYEYFLK